LIPLPLLILLKLLLILKRHWIVLLNNIVPSISITKLECDFLEDLKINKANISLFELMKLPWIQFFLSKLYRGILPRASKK
jgi:hypothetical protein